MTDIKVGDVVRYGTQTCRVVKVEVLDIAGFDASAQPFLTLEYVGPVQPIYSIGHHRTLDICVRTTDQKRYNGRNCAEWIRRIEWIPHRISHALVHKGED